MALARRLVERTGNARFDRVSVGTAGIGHVGRQCRARSVHRQRGASALALLECRSSRAGLAGIIIGFTVGAAFADREFAPVARASFPKSIPASAKVGTTTMIKPHSNRIKDVKGPSRLTGQQASAGVFPLDEREVESTTEFGMPGLPGIHVLG